jgi:hypothetical protein
MVLRVVAASPPLNLHYLWKSLHGIYETIIAQPSLKHICSLSIDDDDLLKREAWHFTCARIGMLLAHTQLCSVMLQLSHNT